VTAFPLLSRRVRRTLAAAAVPIALACGAAPEAAAQTGGGATRRTTTIEALVTYPLFFHTQPVRVRGELRADRGRVSLTDGQRAVLLAGQAVAGEVDRVEPVELLGTFLDVGRLAEGDPRLRNVDVASLWRDQGVRPWPGPGELLLLHVDSLSTAETFAAPTIRALAVAPHDYVDQQVTVVGRFRGRNLFAEQPTAPGRTRWDFVIQSADASLWVTGIRPRGRGFSLDVDARVDTSAWLEVTGTVQYERGLVFLEATALRLAEAPATPPPTEPVARVPTQGPRPEAIFSAPTAEEVDVEPDATVRIQFSRDIEPASIKGQIRVTYLGARSEGDSAPSLAFTTRYDAGLRMLEIAFDEPLERFRTLRVDLGEDIRATDGAPLVPWTLTFTVGGP
jgi:hypothetical protein